MKCDRKINNYMLRSNLYIFHEFKYQSNKIAKINFPTKLDPNKNKLIWGKVKKT